MSPGPATPKAVQLWAEVVLGAPPLDTFPPGMMMLWRCRRCGREENHPQPPPPAPDKVGTPKAALMAAAFRRHRRECPGCGRLSMRVLGPAQPEVSP